MIKSFIELNGEGLCGIALNTSDIEAARNKLVAEGVDIGNFIEGEGKDEARE